ncbi:MAG: hypothetical protein C4516_01865 [Oxalobacter sp.]|nr:MAG: hypothetical protein C4516_01865 [Oxalobacter sp.]
MKNILTRLFIAALCMGVSLASQAQTKKIKEVDEKPVIPFAKGASGRTVGLTKLRTEFATPPTTIGVLRYGGDCNQKFYIGWDKAVYGIYTRGLGEILRAELAKANYPLPQSNQAESKLGPQLHIGAYIKTVHVDYCSKNAEVSLNAAGRKQVLAKNLNGAAYVEVVWQVIAPEEKRVIFETTTEGSYRMNEDIQSSPPAFFRRAYGAAARNLLADKGFHDVVLVGQ